MKRLMIILVFSFALIGCSSSASNLITETPSINVINTNFNQSCIMPVSKPIQVFSKVVYIENDEVVIYDEKTKEKIVLSSIDNPKYITSNSTCASFFIYIQTDTKGYYFTVTEEFATYKQESDYMQHVVVFDVLKKLVPYTCDDRHPIATCLINGIYLADEEGHILYKVNEEGLSEVNRDIEHPYYAFLKMDEHKYLVWLMDHTLVYAHLNQQDGFIYEPYKLMDDQHKIIYGEYTFIVQDSNHSEFILLYVIDRNGMVYEMDYQNDSSFRKVSDSPIVELKKALIPDTVLNSEIQFKFMDGSFLSLTDEDGSKLIFELK